MTVTDWKAIGYSAALSSLQNGMAHFPYPTQDIHTPQDERDYCAGYHEAVSDFHHRGTQVFASYLEEKK